MKNGFLFILIICIVLFYSTSCYRVETYPDIPQIEFVEFHDEDSSVTFSFIDGDGNIGIEQNDTFIAFGGDTIRYNLFTVLYEKVDSLYEEVIFAEPEALNFRIPNVQPEGINKTLKGEINFKFIFNPLVIDTFKIEFFIYDNELNKSNIEITPGLTFNK